MYEGGIRLFVELGPGETLTNMIRKEFYDGICIYIMNSGSESTCILVKREDEK